MTVLMKTKAFSRSFWRLGNVFSFYWEGNRMVLLNGDVKPYVDIDTLKSAEEITIDGCVHRIKDMGAISFIIIRTGQFLVQCVYEEGKGDFEMPQIKTGDNVRVSGRTRAEERAANGVEIVLESVELLSRPAAEYPLSVFKSKMNCSIETNLDYRSVALRNVRERNIFKIQQGVADAFREYMKSQNFTEIHTPKIVAHGAEGGANIFKLKYFGQDAFLAQSPQFYKQTCVAFFDRVFEIGPVFRAEKHNTTRHLNEYTGLDFEMGYIDSMYDVMAMETAMLKYMMKYLEENYSRELSLAQAELPEIDEIPSITFDEAMEILGFSALKADLDPDDEVKLCEYSKEKYGSDFIFVTHFPKTKRPFYAMDDRENPKAALSFDLLFRGLEITTGGQRIHDYNEQVEKMERMGLDPNDFSSYLDIHKYGMPPHGGLGIGLERLVMKLLDLSNIRQASMFPRDANRITP